MSPDYKTERLYAVPPALVAGFQRDLAGIAPGTVTALPDLTGYIKHSGTFPRPELELGTGMAVDYQLLAEQGAPDEFIIDNQVFFNKPPHRLGRENSHNKVFFGLLLANGTGVEAPIGLDVAVKTKPIEKVSALLGEVAMFQYLQSIGIPTFRPYALLRTNDNIHFLTETQQNVDTMDTIEWKSLDLPERWVQMDYAIQTLALLHSNMLFHGDSEFKNIAFGDLGDIVVVDPELMVSCIELAEMYLHGSDERIRKSAFIRIKQCMGSDFSDLTNSIEDTFFRGLPDNERPGSKAALFKELKRHVYNPYRAALYESDSPYRQVLLDAFDVLLHERKEQSRQ